MIRSARPKFYSFLLLVSAGTSLLLLFGSSSNVSAAGEATNTLEHQVVSYSNGTCIVGYPQPATCGGYHSPLSLAYLYVPSTTATASVTLTKASNIKNIYGYSLTVLNRYTNECDFPDDDSAGEWDVPLGALGNGGYSDPNNKKTYTLNISTAQQDSQRTIVSANATYKVFCVQVSTGLPNNANIYYSLSTGAENFLGAYSGNSDSLGTGYFNGNNAIYNPALPIIEANWWSEVVGFSLPCIDSGVETSGAGEITLYDLDTDTSAGRRIEIYVEKRLKSGAGGATNVAISGDLDEFRGNNVYRLTSKPTGSAHKVTVDEGYNSLYVYSVHLDKIGSQNKIRIRVPYDQIYSVVTCGGKPVGYADSCAVDGNKTVIKGWAYDNDAAANSGTPQTKVNIGGDVSKSVTVNSDISGYRTADIEGYLNANGFGGGVARDGQYGWSASFENLVKGTTYSLSGTVINVGGGAGDVGMGVSGNFLGGRLPDSCLPYFPPTCGSVPAVIGDVGLAHSAKATINNPNVDLTLPITSVTYVISGPYIDTNLSGSATDVGNIAANTSREYNFSENINRPSKIAGGADNSHTVTWTIESVITLTCVGTITTVVKPPTCSPVQVNAGTGDIFSPRVTVTNPNQGADMKMNEIKYVINPGPYSGEVAKPIEPTTTIPKTYDGSATSIPTAGQYTTNWTVSWEVTPMSQSLNCTQVVNDTLISNQPYARFYGNDLFAGGGFGSSCSTTGITDAKGYGRNTTQADYKGTASELAVFAVGQIQYVLPGSQRSRSPTQELSFANTLASSIDLASGRFGGGFGSVACSPDYYSKVSSAAALGDTTVDLSTPTLNSGSYKYGSGAGSTTVISTGGGVPNGRRLVIYVEGDAQIKATGGRFGFANVAGNWSTFSDIPSLYIIASGNIYIDSDVSTMDGVYVAQPRLGQESTTGQIYTCSRNNEDPLSNLSDIGAGGNAAFILSSCNNKLTVNGSFIARKVHLLRSNGTVNNGTPFEAASSAGIAEVFRFTPELYLIEGGGLPPRSTNAKIDSIVSLPPSF